MPAQTLQEKFDAIRGSANPFEPLYAIAQSLRDIGLCQFELYRIFYELYLQQGEDEDPEYYEAVTDVLDCISSSGWGRPALFDEPLENEVRPVVSIDVIDKGTDHWDLTIKDPNFQLQFSIENPSIVRQLSYFLQVNLSCRAELPLGTLGGGTVSVVKNDKLPFQFYFCVSTADGTIRYTPSMRGLRNHYVWELRLADYRLSGTK